MSNPEINNSVQNATKQNCQNDYLIYKHAENINSSQISW